MFTFLLLFAIKMSLRRSKEKCLLISHIKPYIVDASEETEFEATKTI